MNLVEGRDECYIAGPGSGRAVADPGLGLNYAMVVHGQQRFEYHRPIGAGDVLTATSTISDINQAGSLTMLDTRTDIQTVSGDPVCSAYSTLVERG